MDHARKLTISSASAYTPQEQRLCLSCTKTVTADTKMYIDNVKCLYILSDLNQNRKGYKMNISNIKFHVNSEPVKSLWYMQADVRTDMRGLVVPVRNWFANAPANDRTMRQRDSHTLGLQLKNLGQTKVNTGEYLTHFSFRMVSDGHGLQIRFKICH